MRKYVKDGHVAVLVSTGFGAGWSTWHDDEYKQRSRFDSRFVEAALAGVKDIEQVADEVFGEGHGQYLNGWRDIEVKWVAKGTKFLIHEYDGSESIWDRTDLLCTA